MKKNNFNKKFKNEYLENKERAIKRIIIDINYELNNIMENINLTNEELEIIKNLKNNEMELLEKFTRDIIEILKYENAKKDNQE